MIDETAIDPDGAEPEDLRDASPESPSPESPSPEEKVPGGEGPRGSDQDLAKEPVEVKAAGDLGGGALPSEVPKPPAEVHERPPAPPATPEPGRIEPPAPCPTCGEEVAAFARSCRHCGELLDPADPERERVAVGPGSAVAFGLGCALLGLFLVALTVTSALLAPAIRSANLRRQQDAAVESLRQLQTAQQELRATLQQRGDPVRYGDLTTLGQAGLLERELATGNRRGYVFEVVGSERYPERWMATASPMTARPRGSRHYATNHTGEIYYRDGRAIPLDSESCELPPDVRPLGREDR